MFKSLNDILGHKPASKKSSYSGRSYQYQDSFDFLQLISNWQQIVGPTLAANTYPLKITNGSLTILTKHSIYSQELSFLAEDIKKQIIKLYPTLKTFIKTLRFQTSSSFFEKKLLQEEAVPKTINKSKHNFDPHYREKLFEAKEEFSDIEDEELKEILVSLYLQRS